MSNRHQVPAHRRISERHRVARITSAAAVLTGLAALAAAAPAPPAPRPPAPADRTLDVVTTEFAFLAPDTVTTGRTRLRLVNRGRELHILEIARLDDGHTAEELAEHLAARRPPPAWATFVGGPLARPDGSTSEDLAVTVDRAPGRYALLCPIPSPADHRPHMLKGMVRTLVVVPARAAGRAAPVIPVARGRSAPARGAAPAVPGRMVPGRVVLDDYGFVVQPAWRAGRHTLRVENRAAQPHELVVFRLAHGKRAADVVRWAGTLAGPAPGTLVAGTTALGRGQTVTLALTLTPGAYALLCFLPDATDGRSHVQHGMTRELTVR